MRVPFTGGFQVDLQCRDDDRPEAQGIQEAVRRWLPAVVGDGYGDRILWVSTYRFLRKVAASFTDPHGRVLLVGEAAHLFPPFGARGMNSGIADAAAAAEAIAAGAGAAVARFAEVRRAAALFNSAGAGAAVVRILVGARAVRAPARGAGRRGPHVLKEELVETGPAVAEGLWTWTPGRGLAPAPDRAAGGRLLVADSWLLREGRVRAYARHRERFSRSCGECGGPEPRRLAAFWQDVTAVLPRTGEWFPRVELAAGSLELRLRLRPAPPLGAGVRLWAAGQSDPRTVPRRKGPDLEALARVRRRAQGEGADEAVLIAPSGTVLESATAGVLWWEDDTLCLPPPRLPVLPGVTAGLVQERALRSGIRVAHRERTVAELDGREVWLTNALHGIRPVTEWTGRPMRVPPVERAGEWRAWLDGMMEPLPES